MSCTLRDLAAAVDRLAPFKLAYDWDNVGLQVGDPAAKVSRVLVCLELNANVIKEATTRKCQAIITHHPAVFKALKSLRSDNPSSQLVMELVRRDMGLIVAHTNLDRVKQGTNGVLADLLGLRDTLVLEPASAEAFYKFTVFVPREYTPKIIEAIHRGGGGRIGNYSHCTFRVSGTGTYIPEAGSTPFAGHIGHLEQADEEKLESIVPAGSLKRVLAEVRHAHPYDEVAFDVFPVHDADPKTGLGMIGTLPLKTDLRSFCHDVRSACGAAFASFAGDAKKAVKKVAILTGSAGSTAACVTKNVADVLVTGELSYHHAIDAVERGIGVVAVGHAASERIFAPKFCEWLQTDMDLSKHPLELIPYTEFPEPWNVVVGSVRKKHLTKKKSKTR